jgi:hypothetical protein
MAMKRNIPEEYMDFDYGFTGVSEDDYRKKQSEADLKVSEIERTANQKLRDANLEKNKIEAAKDRLESNYKDKLYEVEKVVMPLLVNLLKTSDKEYIYWPKRKDQIEKQIDKVLSLTRD